MLRLQVRVLAAGAMALLACGVLAQEPTEVSDFRLGQKVTYKAECVSVSKIFDELSATTEVKLRAGETSRDWRVRDRRMNVFANNVSLAELQRAISETMGFRWSRGGVEEKWYYRLRQDMKSRANEEQLRFEAEEARNLDEKRLRAETVNEYASLTDLSPADINKLRKDDPYLYAMARSGVARGVGDFLRNSPEAADSLVGAQENSMRFADLSLRSQEGLRTSLEGFSRLMGDKSPDSLRSLLASLSDATIDFNSYKRLVAGTPAERMMLADMEIRTKSGGYFAFPFYNSNSSGIKVLGQVLTRVMEGVDPNVAAENMEAEMVNAVNQDTANLRASQYTEEIVRKNYPEFNRKVSLQIKGKLSLDQVLKEFARVTSVNVVSDQFGDIIPSVQIVERQISINDALDRIVRCYNCRWEKKGNFVRIRNRDWFQKRAAQIPDVWMDQWTSTIKKTGTLDIGELADLASLSSEQINANIVNTKDDRSLLREVLARITGGQGFLRFYASLDVVQKTGMMSNQGLSAHVLTPSQWSLLAGELRTRNQELIRKPQVPLIINGTKKPLGKGFIYQFIASSPQSEKACSWIVTTPDYRTD